MNKERFISDFRALGRINAHGNGVAREAYSKEYFEARDFVENLMKQSGMTTKIDSVGNLFGHFPTDAKKILVGSHLDSVPHGGIYDGHLGVMAALEAARSLKHLPIEVVAFIAEEGGPMGGTFGSRAVAGTVEKTVVTGEELLKKAGLSIEKIRAAALPLSDYVAFLELHIEQGPFLERKNISIGIPTGIVCINRRTVTVTGAANHAGTTPMRERKDAMREAADLISRWFQWVDTQEGFVSTVGIFGIEPNSVAIVPGEAKFALEIRSLEDTITFKAAEKFDELLKSVPRHCKVSLDKISHKEAVGLDVAIGQKIAGACELLGFSHTFMPSGASHDAAALAKYLPTAMIFVPSAGGVSHSPLEFTNDDDIIRGAEVLEQTIKNILEGKQ